MLLEHAPNAHVARRFADAKHVRPVRQLALVNAGDAEDEAEQRSIGVEGTGRDSTDVVDDMQERGGHDIRLGKSPDLALQVDAVVAILQRLERTDAHVRAGGRFSREVSAVGRLQHPPDAFRLAATDQTRSTGR